MPGVERYECEKCGAKIEQQAVRMTRKDVYHQCPKATTFKAWRKLRRLKKD